MELKDYFHSSSLFKFMPCHRLSVHPSTQARAILTADLTQVMMLFTEFVSCVTPAVVLSVRVPVFTHTGGVLMSHTLCFCHTVHVRYVKLFIRLNVPTQFSIAFYTQLPYFTCSFHHVCCVSHFSDIELCCREWADFWVQVTVRLCECVFYLPATRVVFVFFVVFSLFYCRVFIIAPNVS